jgi:hypothetical protein
MISSKGWDGKEKGSRRYEGGWKKAIRRLVEAVGSVLRLYLGERVHAVTARRLLLKVMMAIISYDLNCLFHLLFYKVATWVFFNDRTIKLFRRSMF